MNRKKKEWFGGTLKKAREILEKNKKNTGGFTLVELMVVLSIMVIMMGVGYTIITGWIDYANFKRQNEYAQTIFVAAQNQLNDDASNGQLGVLNTSLQELARTDPRVQVINPVTDSYFKNDDGVPYDEKQVWPNIPDSITDQDERDKYKDTIYSIICTGDDYAEYKAGNVDDQSAVGIFYGLLDTYVYDKSIFDATICLEFTAQDGQVFSALYSDIDSGFEYNQSNENKKGNVVDIYDRTRSVRKTKMIGYYGVDSLSKATSTKTQKPVISNVSLNNDETLNLSFKLSKVQEAATQLSYEINVYDSNEATATKVLSINLSGSSIKKLTGTADNPLSRPVVMCNVKRYVSGSGAKDLGQLPFNVWQETDGTIRMVLDAADLSATSNLYYQEYNDIKTAEKDVYLNQKFVYTNSFHRFGIDSENIYCTIKGSGTGYKATAEKQSNVSNVYFADDNGGSKTSVLRQSEDGKEAGLYIANIRHLYNVRYIEDLEGTTDTTKPVNYAEKLKITYGLCKDISWTAFINNGNLYKSDTGNRQGGLLNLPNGVEVAGTSLAFPSIRQLHADSTFNSNTTSSTGHTIADLTISTEANRKAEIWTLIKEKETDTTYLSSTGLFLVNYGNVKYITLDNAVINGNYAVVTDGTEKLVLSDNVGSICGLNSGNLSHIEVKSTKSSTVIGNENVGGLVGRNLEITSEILNTYSAGVNPKMTLDNLTNRSEVTGQNNVGGIAGKLSAVNTSRASKEEDKKVYSTDIEVDECKNYGVAQGRISEQHNNEAEKIGGIVGYADGSTKDDNIQTVEFKISNCTSSPQYTSVTGSVDEIRKQFFKRLYGRYVGGIVGYNQDAQIALCNTEKEKNKEGFVIGYEYVGGIVGFNAGTASNKINGEDNNKNGINEANVIGYEYVGGIVGANTTQPMENGKTNDDIYISETKQLQLEISNWTNKGVVISTGNYVGGITGYNDGFIFNCSSDVSSDGEIKNLTNANSTYGSYAGGIAGYNNGIIGNTKKTVKIVDGKEQIASDGKTQGVISAVSYINGKNYVGGIVGYNDVDAIVEDYQLNGGNIIGTGSFIGGYAGFNASIDLLMDTENNQARNILSSPNEVKGMYCIGGTIGGNIVATDHDITASFKTDNFLGNIEATEAVIGGYIGYNQLASLEADKKDIHDVADLIVSKLEPKKDGETITKLALKDVVDQLDNTLSYPAKKTNDDGTELPITFYIQGENEGGTQTKFGNITAQIYAGGVMGYSDKDTYLYIKDVTNLTPVTATEAIINTAEQGLERKTYLEGDFQYAYAGGIIGKVSENVTVDNCRNADVGDVVADKATYTGALCEINEGTIINCEVSSIGDNTTDYVGGIAGLNKDTGYITNTTFEKQTVTGRNYVGGIVAENFGKISEIDQEDATATVTGYGDNIGGIAGYNANTNAGIKSDIIISSDFSVNITSTGDNVGGLVGDNNGGLSVADVEDSTNTTTKEISGTVIGSHNIGGIIGLNESGNINGFYNSTTVTAIDGYAGGIIGENQSGEISNCINNGDVSSNGEAVADDTVNEAPNAGGIVAVNNAGAIISNCGDNANVAAANGTSGGITSVNKGTIKNCVVTIPTPGENASWWQNIAQWFENIFNGKTKLMFASMNNVGGIAGINTAGASITNSSVYKLDVKNTDRSDISNIGAIVGNNAGSIALNGNAVSACEVSTYTSGSNVGGVAGLNTGSINGKSDENNSDIAVTIGFASNSVVYANLGGVSGKNGDGGSITGCAVVSDITGDMGAETYGYGGVSGVNYGSINDCSYDGKLHTNGSADNVVNVGGITGINNSNAVVNACIVGKNEDTVVTSGFENTTSAMGYVGGMVGWNYGTVKNSDNAAGSSAKVSITNYAGHTGGIVGYNMAGAIVTGESSDNKLSTGKEWAVRSNKYSNDCGTGGIMGYSASGQDISYTENNASVYATDSSAGNVTGGGLIGRMENKENDAMTITAFENNGTISSALTGGAIGRMKYKGAYFVNCANYGAITPSKSGGSAAGLVATMYMMDAGANVTFESCSNFGNITNCSNGAGIIANSDTNNIPTVIISDSVNEGIVNASNAGGIAALTGKASVYLYRCRNYGVSTSGNFAGIIPSNYKVMSDCISTSNRANITNNGGGTITDSYYLSTATGDDDDNLYLASSGGVTCNGNINGSYPVTNLYGMDSKRFVFSASGTKTVAFSFDNNYNLTNFGLYWANDGKANVVKQYKFQVSCNDGQYYLNSSGQWTSDANDAYDFISYGTDNLATSYWSTALDGSISISSVKITVAEVQTGKITDGLFQQTTTTLDSNVYLYAVTASKNNNSNTSTSQAVYDAQAAVDEKKTSYEEAKAKYEEALSKWETQQKLYNEALYNINWGVTSSPVGGSAGDILTNSMKADRITWEKRWVINKGKDTVITLEAPTPTNIDGLGIYWASSSDIDSKAAVRTYQYTVKYTYENGEIYTTDTLTGTGAYKTNTNETDSTGALVTSKKVSKIEIKIVSAKEGNSDKAYTCLWAIHIKGDITSDMQAAYDQAETDYTTSKSSFDVVQKEFDEAELTLAKARYYIGNIVNEGAIGIKQTTTSSEDSKYGFKAISKIQTGTSENTYTFQGTGSDPKFMIGGLWLRPSAGWTDMSSNFIKNVSGTSGKGNRQNVYEELEGEGNNLIEDYYKRKTANTSALPKDVTINNSAGLIKVSWSHENGNYYADQLVYRVKSADGTVIYSHYSEPIDISYGIGMYSIEVPSNWEHATIEMYVRSISGNYDGGYTEEEYSPDQTQAQQDNASAWVGNSMPIKASLPTPKVYLELGAYDNVNAQYGDGFVAVLENASDYKNIDCTITVSFDCDVYDAGTGSSLSKKVSFDVSSGRSKAFRVNTSGSNQMITAQATKSVDYADSVAATVQVALYGASYLKGNSLVNETFKDFYGDLMGNLYNRIELKNAKTFTELYMNTELMISNYAVQDISSNDDGTTSITNVGVFDVVVAKGNSHVNQYSGTMTSNLNNLPEDLLSYNTVTVRAYPWETQSFICRYGHAVTLPDGKITMTTAQLRTYVENRSLEDSQANNQKIFVVDPSSGKTVLSNGYVLRLESDGTYSIIYSSILANSSLYGTNQIKSKTYTITQQSIDPVTAGKVTSDSYDKLIQNKPVISESLIENENDNVYTFRWDTGMTDNEAKNASYQLQLTGTLDGKSVLLGSADVDYSTVGSFIKDENGKNVWQYSFVDTSETWNYTNLTLKVVRVGTLNSSGQTNVFPSSSSQDFQVKLHFSTISRPTLSLLREDNEVKKNSLEYTITWPGIPNEEVASGDLASYEVTTTRNANDKAATTTFDNQDSYTKELTRLVELYKNKVQDVNPVTPVQDGDTITYTFQWSEDDRGNAVTKTMILKGNKTIVKVTEDGKEVEKPQWTIDKTLTAVWSFLAGDKSTDELSGTLTEILNLNDFERGETINISVKAIAKEDSTIYKDGKAGVIREMTLPERLEVPKLNAPEAVDTDTNLSLAPEYGKDTFMILPDMDGDGITLNISGQSNTMQGKYQLAVAVYDELNGDSQKDMSKVTAGDEVEGSDTYWNTGALLTIFTKADEKKSTGNFESASLAITSADIQAALKDEDVELADYAGKWLKIAVRAVSDSNISSWWTDEDDNDLTYNYIWVRIPRAQIAEPTLSQSTVTNYYKDVNGQWIMPKDPNKDQDEELVQTLLSYNVQKYAEGYVIDLVRRANVDNNITYENRDYTIRYFDNIYLKKVVDAQDGSISYNVFYNSTQPHFEVISWNDDGTVKEHYPKQGEKYIDSNTQVEIQVPDFAYDEEAVYLGNIKIDGDEATIVNLPYTQNIPIESHANPLQPASYLYLNEIAVGETDKETVVNLVLPDVTVHNGDSTGIQYLTTEEINNRAVIFDEKMMERYQDSTISNWYQAIGESDYSTRITTYEEYAEAIEVKDIAPELSISNIDKIAYQLRSGEASGNARTFIYDIEIRDPNASDESTAVKSQRIISSYCDYGSTTWTSLLLMNADDYAKYAEYDIRIRMKALLTGGGVSKWSEWQDYGKLPEITVDAPVVYRTAINMLVTPYTIPGFNYRWDYSAADDTKIEGYTLTLTQGEVSKEITIEIDSQNGTITYKDAVTGQVLIAPGNELKLDDFEYGVEELIQEAQNAVPIEESAESLESKESVENTEDSESEENSELVMQSAKTIIKVPVSLKGVWNATDKTAEFNIEFPDNVVMTLTGIVTNENYLVMTYSSLEEE